MMWSYKTALYSSLYIPSGLTVDTNTLRLRGPTCDDRDRDSPPFLFSCSNFCFIVGFDEQRRCFIVAVHDRTIQGT